MKIKPEMTEELPDVDWSPGRIDSCFPYEKYREGQREAIEFAAKAFQNGKQIVIMECPTGSGKSGIAMTLAEMANTSYYLTITKILQDQLIKDFGKSPTSLIRDRTAQILELKGRNAYKCNFYQLHGRKYVEKKLISQRQLEYYLNKPHDCNNGFCRTKLCPNNSRCETCFRDLPLNVLNSTCPYYEQVYKAICNRKVVMNFSSFLYQTYFTDRFDIRDLLILDESHNAESQLLDFVSLTLNDLHLQNSGVSIPKLDSPVEYALFFDKMCIGEHLKRLLSQAKDDENNKLEDELANTIYKFELFMSHISKPDSEWIHEYSETNRYRSVTIKPVYAMDFPQELLFKYAKKALLMSATILDVGIICKSLGIPRNKVAAYRMKNRFPIENRKIFYNPVAIMTGGKSKMHTWMPKVITKVDKIMAKYPNSKGIIHTHNFAIMDDLLAKCDIASKKRFLDQRTFDSKLELLQFHFQSNNSVIIAPAMHEGIDLIGDLSRFQIICKVPYPSLGDPQLARRMELDRTYYTWITSLKLCQSYGRSIRSESDFADTYIIDGAFTKFRQMAKNILPEWFTEAIVEE